MSSNFLLGFAIYRARRYRLTRTRWRGIRAGQTGEASRYAALSLGYLLLSLMTLGLTVPLLNTRLQQYRMANTWIGNRQFRFDAEAGPLFRKWLFYWVLLVPTLGLSYFWYRAAETRYFAEHTAFEELRFALPVTGGDLLRIYSGYALGVIGLFLAVAIFAFVVTFLVLGAGALNPAGFSFTPSVSALPLLTVAVFFIALPALGIVLVTHRLARLVGRRLEILGEQDFDSIVQSSRAIPARGEGLADALDVGGI